VGPEGFLPGRQDRFDRKLIQILRDACSIFARKGYHNASVRDVATATGVSPAGLYYYFSSKEELLFLILKHTLSSLLSRTRKALTAERKPEARIGAVIGTYLEFFSEHGEEIRVLERDGEALTGDFREKISRLQTTYEEMVATVLRELRPGIGAEDLRASVMGLFGMLAWTHRWYRLEEDPPLEDLTGLFAELFLRGFLSSGSSVTGTS